HDWGSEARRYYWVAPVSEVVRDHVRGVATHPVNVKGPAGAVYIAGVSLDLDIFHSGPMEAFAVCVPVPSGQLNDMGLANGAQFSIAGKQPIPGQKGDHVDSFWSLSEAEGLAGIIGQAAFESVDNRSLFGAKAKKGILPTGDSFLNKKSQGSHSGVAKWDLLKRPVGSGSGNAAGSYIDESLRAYWKIDKEVPVCNEFGQVVGDRYMILCGIKTWVETKGNVGPYQTGWMKNVHANIYIRVK
ncbi:hypothetical protein B0T10DRAFT_571534, partial [Thelonectria olida]